MLRLIINRIYEQMRRPAGIVCPARVSAGEHWGHARGYRLGRTPRSTAVRGRTRLTGYSCTMSNCHCSGSACAVPVLAGSTPRKRLLHKRDAEFHTKTGVRDRMILPVMGVLFAFSSTVLALEFDRGAALYENHCQYCHESWAHERDGRTVNSRAALRQRVTAWSVHSSLEWTDDEIDDVTDYLDRRFYQFGD